MEQTPFRTQVTISEHRALEQSPAAAPATEIRLVRPSSSPHFKPYAGSRFSGWVRSDLSDTSYLDAPDGFEQLQQAERLVARKGRSIVRVPLKVGGQLRNCFVHHFLNDTFSRYLQRSYASRVLELSVKLKDSGFQSIDVVAAVRRKHSLLNTESLVIALEIPNVSEIAARKTERSRIQPARDFTAEMAGRLAQTVASLHTRGFFHGDLKTRHLLVTLESPYQFHFIDLESCQYRPRLPRYIRDLLATRDIIQLFSSLPVHEVTERDSPKDLFLEEYCRCRGLEAGRVARIRNWIELYGPRGQFRQGRTLLDNLVRAGLAYVPFPRSTKLDPEQGPRPTEPANPT